VARSGRWSCHSSFGIRIVSPHPWNAQSQDLDAGFCDSAFGGFLSGQALIEVGSGLVAIRPVLILRSAPQISGHPPPPERPTSSNTSGNGCAAQPLKLPAPALPWKTSCPCVCGFPMAGGVSKTAAKFCSPEITCRFGRSHATAGWKECDRPCGYQESGSNTGLPIDTTKSLGILGRLAKMRKPSSRRTG
jgi:hypothetical protein